MVEAALTVRRHLTERDYSKWVISLTIFIICIVFCLGILAVLAWVASANPLTIARLLFEGAFGNKLAITSTLQETVPIALTAIAFYIPYRLGFFNIGAVGQLELGALAAVYITTSSLPLPPWLTILLAFLAAFAAGGLIMLPALVLKTWRGASEVTTTIMLNFIAIEFVLAMVNGPMKDVNAFYGTTEIVPDELLLPSTLFIGFWLTVAIILMTRWVLNRTTFGFKLDASGGNPLSAQAAGINVRRTLVVAILVSGAIAGIAGCIQVLGVVHQVAEDWSRPWGFIGILAALLGGSPIGILFASIILGGLETGGRHMQAMTGVPAAMVFVLQGVPVLIYLSLRAMPRVRRAMQNKVAS